MHDKILKKIVNHQFQIIGVEVKFEDIPEEGIKVGKKLVKWYDYYFFENEDQYMVWKRWALKELEKINSAHRINEIDMLYGLQYKMRKVSCFKKVRGS